MKPDRYEWQNEERKRVKHEGASGRHVSDAYTELLMRAGGLMLAMILMIVVLQALPRTPEGTIQPRAVLVTGIILAAFSSAVLHWPKPVEIVAKWALGTTLGMGCLLLLITSPT